VQDRIKAVGSKTATIEPGSPWENGYGESLSSELRDPLLVEDLGGKCGTLSKKPSS